jgi:hypothetical protein
MMAKSHNYEIADIDDQSNGGIFSGDSLNLFDRVIR